MQKQQPEPTRTSFFKKVWILFSLIENVLYRSRNEWMILIFGFSGSIYTKKIIESEIANIPSDKHLGHLEQYFESPWIPWISGWSEQKTYSMLSFEWVFYRIDASIEALHIKFYFKLFECI